VYNQRIGTQPNAPIPIAPLKFMTLVHAAEELSRKRVRLRMELTHATAQVSTRKIQSAYYSWKMRRVEKEARNLVKMGLVRQEACNDYIEQSYNRRRKESAERSALLKVFCTYITSVQTGLRFHVHSGEDISLTLERVAANLPVVHLANFPLNPFSTTLPLFGKVFLGLFKPTHTERVSIKTVDEDSVDIMVR
jgi:hypothetical protein